MKNIFAEPQKRQPQTRARKRSSAGSEISYSSRSTERPSLIDNLTASSTMMLAFLVSVASSAAVLTPVSTTTTASALSTGAVNHGGFGFNYSQNYSWITVGEYTNYMLHVFDTNATSIANLSTTPLYSPTGVVMFDPLSLVSVDNNYPNNSNSTLRYANFQIMTPTISLVLNSSQLLLQSLWSVERNPANTYIFTGGLANLSIVDYANNFNVVALVNYSSVGYGSLYTIYFNSSCVLVQSAIHLYIFSASNLAQVHHFAYVKFNYDIIFNNLNSSQLISTRENGTAAPVSNSLVIYDLTNMASSTDPTAVVPPVTICTRKRLLRAQG